MAEYFIGQIVFSRQGRDKGLIYVICGIEENNKRVKLIRPNKYNVNNPKIKNPKHLQLTHKRAEELIEKIKAGNNIDAGYFHRSVGING